MVCFFLVISAKTPPQTTQAEQEAKLDIFFLSCNSFLQKKEQWDYKPGSVSA